MDILKFYFVHFLKVQFVFKNTVIMLIFPCICIQHSVSSRILTPLKNWPRPKRENPPDCNILNPPWVSSLKVGGNSHYHSPFPKKNIAHLVSQSVGRSVGRSVSRSVGRSVGRSVCLSVCLSVRRYVRPSVCPSVRPSVSQSVSQSVSHLLT